MKMRKSHTKAGVVKLKPDVSREKVFRKNVLKNYASCRNVHELAKACLYDCPKTFTRHFKRCFRQTPYQWMLDKKMEEIRILTLNSNKSITEISRMYEFKSAAHLITVYTNRFGITPYRNRSLSGVGS